MLKDMHSNIDVKQGFIPAVVTSDQNGATVDLKDMLACAMVANVGASGDTLSGSVYILLELEHSDDGSAWSDCADADLSAAVSGANTGTFAKIDDPAEDALLYKVGYMGSKRYLRCVINVVGTHTNGTPIGVQAVCKSQKKPPL